MSIDRRDFLKALGVAGAATAAGCDYNSPVPIPAPLNFLEDPYVPYEKVLPYVVQDEQVVTGVRNHIATRCDECSAGCGVVASLREGRVTQVEGNAREPISGGNICAKGVAGIQATYSPDRFTGPRRAGQPTTWDEAIQTIGGALKGAVGGIAWLGRPRTGSLGALIGRVLGAGWGRIAMWEPLGPDALRAAVRALWGVENLPTWHLAAAHTVVSFGADFTASWLSPVEHSRGWADSRDPAKGGFVSRTVFVSQRLGSSGVLADVHLSPQLGAEVDVALALAKLVATKRSYTGPAASAFASVDPAAVATKSGISAERLEELAGWLAEHPSAILPGSATDSSDPTALATAVMILNEVCGNIGKTVRFGDEHRVAGFASTEQVRLLLEDCAAGKVKVLFIDDLDPVFNLPTGIDVAAALAKVETLVVFANEENESTVDGAWVLPPGTTVETWGDATARTGHYVVQQQAMRPLHDTRALGDILLGLAKVAGVPTRPPADPATELAVDPAAAVQPAAIMGPDVDAPDYKSWLIAWWRAEVWATHGQPGGDFDSWWVSTLKDGGFFPGVAEAPAPAIAPVAAPTVDGAPAGDGAYTLMVFAHPFLHDGRHANKPWAQEVPEPVSSYAWTTWAEIHPSTAEKLGLTKTDTVKVSANGAEIEVDWFPSKGIRPDVVAVVLGNGKKKGGRYTRYGANPMRLLTAATDRGGAMRFVTTKGSVAKTGKERTNLPYLGSLDQQGRYINYVVSKDDLGTGDKPGSILPHHHPPVDERLTKAGLNDMFPEPNHPTYRFAMAVDLNRCTGCGACMTACHSENNIPVVGPEQFAKSRYMGWIRLSRYWEGDGETPDVRFQPVMCQQCSHAPCEGVCPVLATYHNIDGLNAMIYNRCVGTRYCANNCPYTARRFNFHTYRWPDSFNLMLNPEVSTRDMGVMEKCTFCVQRTREIKDRYRDQGFTVTVPHEALDELTACAKACPADAMVFGNAKVPESTVARQFAEPRAYAMLGELNNKPGVRYLARINHIPSLAHHGGQGEDHGTGSHDPAKSGGDHH